MNFMYCMMILNYHVPNVNLKTVLSCYHHFPHTYSAACHRRKTYLTAIKVLYTKGFEIILIAWLALLPL